MSATARRCILITLALALSALPLAPAGAQSPPNPPDLQARIKAGNAAYNARDYAGALDHYPDPADLPADLPNELRARLLHNRAAAAFQLDRIDEARALWAQSATAAPSQLEAHIRYNLGNCDYREVLTALEQAGLRDKLTDPKPRNSSWLRYLGLDRVLGGDDAPAAELPALPPLIDQLDRAAKEYRDALRLDRRLMDARANLELAIKLKRRLEALQEEQEQQQQQQQNEDGQQNQEQQQQNQQQSDDDQQNQQQQNQQQQDSQDSSQQQPNQQPPQTQPADQPNDQPQQQQDESQPQTQPAQTQPAEAEPQPTAMLQLTQEQAERLLQLLRDAEHRRRMLLKQREAARQEPVKKDW